MCQVHDSTRFMLNRSRRASKKKIAVAVGLALFTMGAADTASAQMRIPCRSPQPKSVGVAVGRSLPGVELTADAVEAEPGGSIGVASGMQIAGRTDLPLIGPLRARVEAATARWNVQRTVYSSDPSGPSVSVVSKTSIDRMRARHLVGLVGVRTGWEPMCAHVSVGGGLYSIGLRDTSVRRAGAAIAAGMEIPAGSRSFVQLDATLHLIGTRDVPRLASTGVLTLSLLAGWAYRF